MREPGKYLRHRAKGNAGGNRRSGDHDNRKPKRARGLELGACAVSPGILGNDEFAAMSLKKGTISGFREGAARDFYRHLRQGQRRGGRINKPRQIDVLGPRREGREMLAPDRQKDSGRRGGQSGHGGIHIGHRMPVIPRSGPPWRALQRGERQTSFGAGAHSMGAHLRGEGMRCVDHMRDVFGAQVCNQSRNPAKAAAPLRQGDGAGRCSATSVGKHRVNAARSQRGSKIARFSSSAQKKEARHV